MPIRAVIFDIGDTLWRLDPLPDDLDRQMAAAVTANSSVAAAAALALVRASLERARNIASDGRHEEPDLVEVILAAADSSDLELPADAAVAAAAALGAADIGRLVSRPEPAGIFADLRRQGIAIGLLSNTWTAANVLSDFVERQRALGYVAAATFSSAERMRKPHPDLYARALDRLGAVPNETLFVGDRVREDVVGPQAVGMRAALTHEHRQEPPGEARPDAVLSSLGEVIELVVRLNSASDE
jgi:putative hydrolase of the HAD superfamily